MRERIYNEHIRVPFEKLKNIIHTFKFYYFDVPSEDVKHEVVSFLYMNMHKFTEGKGKERHLVISVLWQRIILFYITITITKNLNKQMK